MLLFVVLFVVCRVCCMFSLLCCVVVLCCCVVLFCGVVCLFVYSSFVFVGVCLLMCS